MLVIKNKIPPMIVDHLDSQIRPIITNIAEIHHTIIKTAKNIFCSYVYSVISVLFKILIPVITIHHLFATFHYVHSETIQKLHPHQEILWHCRNHDRRLPFDPFHDHETYNFQSHQKS